MGAVPAEVVVSTFFNFNPGLVHAVVPAVWEWPRPWRLRARFTAVDRYAAASWATIWQSEVRRAAELARLAAEGAAARRGGRSPGTPRRLALARRTWCCGMRSRSCASTAATVTSPSSSASASGPGSADHARRDGHHPRRGTPGDPCAERGRLGGRSGAPPRPGLARRSSRVEPERGRTAPPPVDRGSYRRAGRDSIRGDRRGKAAPGSGSSPAPCRRRLWPRILGSPPCWTARYAQAS